METFSALLALCAGISLVTDEFPTQRPATQSFDVFFDLRRHLAHYDVSVMGGSQCKTTVLVYGVFHMGQSIV